MRQSEVLIKLLEQQASMEKSLSNIRSDLNEHMRRTAILEGRTDRFERFMYMTHGIVAFILGSGAIIAIIKYFQ